MRYKSITVKSVGFLQYRWRNNLTPAGRMMFFILFLSGVGTITLRVPIYQIFFGVISFLFAVGIAGRIYRPKLEIVGNIPSKVTAGHSVTGEFRLKNIGRKNAYDVSIGFPELHRSLQQVDDSIKTISILNPGETENLDITLKTHQRGIYELPNLKGFSYFPFGLEKFGKSRCVIEPLLVLPSFHPLNHLQVPKGRRYQPGGIAMTSNVGESPEYIGNRDYSPGDPVRRIDFRSWAKTGSPVVREYQDEYYCRIALILDTHVDPSRKKGKKGFRELEAAISLIASIADHLSNGEYIIDFFAAGPDLHVFRAGRHTAHLDSVLEILACVEETRKNPFDEITPSIIDELGNITTAICVFLDWNEPRSFLARSAIEAGCALKTIVVREGKTTMPIHQSDSGDLIQLTPEDIEAGGIDIL